LCGPKIARRTVVVFTWHHRFDSGPNASASLAQHALVVSASPTAIGCGTWST